MKEKHKQKKDIWRVCLWLRASRSGVRIACSAAIARHYFFPLSGSTVNSRMRRAQNSRHTQTRPALAIVRVRRCAQRITVPRRAYIVSPFRPRPVHYAKLAGQGHSSCGDEKGWEADEDFLCAKTKKKKNGCHRRAKNCSRAWLAADGPTAAV